MTGEWKSSFYSYPACHSISALLTWQLLPPDHCYMSQIKYWCNRAINIFPELFPVFYLLYFLLLSKRQQKTASCELAKFYIIRHHKNICSRMLDILSWSDCQACLNESYNWVICGSVLTRNKNWQFSLIWFTGSTWFNQFIMQGRPFPFLENQSKSSATITNSFFSHYILMPFLSFL